MLSTTSEGQGGSGVSSWGFIIFFLILFWLWGGNGFGFGPGRAPVPGAGFDNLADVQHHAHQSERDVLCMNTTLSEQTAAIQNKLSEMAFAQEAQTARILEGQKDLYIRDLERAATNMFITGQTSAITSRLDALEAAGALQRQSDQAALSAQIAAVQAGMLKAPAFVPYGGLPSIGCANYGPCGCGCANA